MSSTLYVDMQGNILGIFGDGAEPDVEALALDIPDGFVGSWKYNHQTGAWVTPIPEFKPIEPTPFWLAAWDLLHLKKSDVLNSITDPDERYEAELQIEGRKTYRRDDPMVIQLATLLGYPAEQMDDLWLFVQANYV